MGTEHPAQATPQGKREFGLVANSTPLTGYEPNFDVEVNSEHTPIPENDFTTTDAASEDNDRNAQRFAASGSQQAVASTVPTLLNSGSSSGI